MCPVRTVTYLSGRLKAVWSLQITALADAATMRARIGNISAIDSRLLRRGQVSASERDTMRRAR
jgi:hypothetical protein